MFATVGQSCGKTLQVLEVKDPQLKGVDELKRMINRKLLHGVLSHTPAKINNPSVSPTVIGVSFMHSLRTENFRCYVYSQHSKFSSDMRTA